MNIHLNKQKDKIIIEIDKYQDATDAIGEKVGEIDNVIGIACRDNWGNEELGFSHLSDRTYKDAGPDICEMFLHVYREKEEFIKLCRDLGIDFYEYPVCAICSKNIYGCHTIDSKCNPIHEECEKKEKQNK